MKSVHQTFYWDGNVAVMEEDDKFHFYLQDELGSSMNLLDEGGNIKERYRYDEFGNATNIIDASDLFTNPKGKYTTIWLYRIPDGLKRFILCAS